MGSQACKLIEIEINEWIIRIFFIIGIKIMLLTLLVFLFTHGKCSSTKEKSPHIIFILADDMVYCIQF